MRGARARVPAAATSIVHRLRPVPFNGPPRFPALRRRIRHPGRRQVGKGRFTPFQPRAGILPGEQLFSGYQVALTNASDVTAQVSGFSVVFFDRGAELGSTSAGVDDQFVAPGQSLTWDEETSLMNTGSEGAVGTTDTCTLVQWNQ